jgi:hypothetical protein
MKKETEQRETEQKESEGTTPPLTMDTLSETVGLFPNLKGKDNLYQGMIVGLGTLLVAFGSLFSGQDRQDTLLYSLVALIGLGLISGLALMILGWHRTAKKYSK